MLRNVSVLILVIALAVTVTRTPTFAASAGATNGKSCRMEQQCRWENFKKICTWMKVCR
jgi:hypothetical protein